MQYLRILLGVKEYYAMKRAEHTLRVLYIQPDELSQTWNRVKATNVDTYTKADSTKVSLRFAQ